MGIRTRRVLMAVVILANAACASADAQQYPARPLRIVVPFAAGGASDVVARLLAQKLTESLGQPVIVDNRPGAGANIGIGIAAKAPPDGYTLLVSSSAFTVNPTLYSKIPYDPYKDFQPLTCVGSSPNILAVYPAFAAKSVKELIELVRSQPGKHNYSSPGAGTTPHLSGEMLRIAFKLDLRHIPYGGAGPQVQSLISGQVPIGFASVPSFAPQVKAGQLRGLAVTADKRVAALPEVPAMGELGIAGMSGDTFQGVLVPAGTPKQITGRLYADIKKALAAAEVRERLITIGFEPIGNSPEEFAAQIRSDIARWGKVIRDAQIKAD
ncbi:MAG TPA: tripartite tricarboxylate transporter substrate binding protein [Burkholderiales bacterium]|nr:tripartite tricarboxylate transporter substrate binding protein [Burkholderiales bacterium]